MTGSNVADIVDDTSDPIAPDRIMHGCDEIYDAPGKLSQRYNFLDYEFSRGALRLTCRAYTDTIWRVALDGPEDAAGDADPSPSRDWWLLRDAVLRYLSRRFLVVGEWGTACTEVWLDRDWPRQRAWVEEPAPGHGRLPATQPSHLTGPDTP